MPKHQGTEATGVRTVRVVIGDNHAMVAHSLGIAIGSEPGLEVVGTATSVADCLRLADELGPDVVVMDLRLGDGDGDGLEATRRLRMASPDINVILLTTNPDDGALTRALDAGCSGFVTKRARLEELTVAIRAAANGTTTFPRDMEDRPVRRDEARPPERAELSRRELEVLRLLAAGHSTTAVASELGLSVHTTRNHVRNLMTKLGAHSRLDAVVTAARSGLIDLPHRS
jgi:DNA-binding NarL/FixJ family response regulator